MPADPPILTHAVDPRTLAVDHLNHYGGTVHHHYDGDTVFALLWDPLAQLYLLAAVRVRGVQAPELHDRGGPTVAAAVADLAPVGTAVLVGDVGPYPRPGHITGSITTHAGVDVATWLLERGYAVRWDGSGAKPPVPWPPAAAAGDGGGGAAIAGR